MKDYSDSPLRRKFCLNGLWDFSVSSDSTERLPETWEDTPIKVPSPFNVNSFTRSHNRRYAGEEIYVQGGDFRLYPEYPAEWENARCGFYRTSVFLPEELRGQRIFLRFEGAAFHCRFYLNGCEIAETMEAFLPIEIEITDCARFGESNELIAACESAGYLMYKGRDGRNRLDVPRGSFWGEHIAGIWQDCWLITRPAAYVDDVFAVTDVYERKLTVKLASKHAEGCTADLLLKKRGSAEDRRTIVTGADACGEAVWNWQEGGVDLWDLRQPNLYELTAVLWKDGEMVDEKTIRIGFRTMTADGEKFVLNGRRINLKIDAWHYMGYTVQSPEYARAYYRMAFDAGVNIIRLHAEPFPEFFLDIADEMGMLIVSESAVWASHCAFSYSPDFFRNSKEHIARMIVRDRNHPSVVMWSPENECIPAFMFCGSDYVKTVPELETLVAEFLDTVYEYDTSRLVSCDGSGDLGGRLPVNSLHYPHYDCPTHRGKPITIGEMGSMYYSTPDTVTKEFGRGALACFDGRLESVAEEAYHDLIGERKWASQICVFNLIWYGLRPMPFEDRRLSWDDYSTPGVKPSRITPYMRTLNAGAQEDLPDYLPNPVWTTMKEAYRETAVFPEFFPERIWKGGETAFRLTVFSDQRDDAAFTLVTSFRGCEDGNRAFHAEDCRELAIRACEYTEEFVRFTPTLPGKYELTADLRQNGNTVHRITEVVTVLDRDEWQAAMADTGVRIVTEGELPEGAPVIDCRNAKPYADYLRPATQRKFFFPDGGEIAYPRPVECRVFDSCLSFGGIPVLTDGSGNAAAVDLTCAGEKRIVCGLDLTKNDADTAALALALAEKLAAETVKAPEKPYFFGDPSSPLASLLGELGCEYELLTKETLLPLLKRKQERLLIVDGSADFDEYERFSENNFARVLIASPKKTPRLFRNDLTVTERRIYHCVAENGADERFGLCSNALYGLEANRETALTDGALEFRGNGGGILLGVPDIDWMYWNNVAEPIKTVAILRSEQQDRSRLAALAVKQYAGSELYLTTLACTMDSLKVKNIWARLLSGFGVSLEMRQNDELQNLLSAGMYSAGLRKMLVRTAAEGEDPAEAHPAFNFVERGSGWNLCRADRSAERENALYAVYVTSPADRRDLLLNPDFVDMSFSADAEAKVWLNGVPVGEGKSFDVTGIPLAGGVNLLLAHIPGRSGMPKITFRRAKKLPLDLGFSLLSGSLKAVSLQGVKWSANENDFYSSHASFTREHFWSTNVHQRPGIALDLAFPEEVTVRALWYVAIKFWGEGEDYRPRRYRILAGEDAEHLCEVYVSLPEREMSYPRGRVFVELDRPVAAKFFRYELLEEADKELVISDLTLFG